MTTGWIIALATITAAWAAVGLLVWRLHRKGELPSFPSFPGGRRWP